MNIKYDCTVMLYGDSVVMIVVEFYNKKIK